MTMTPKQIGERLLAIRNEIVGKFGEQPYICPTLDVQDDGTCRIILWRGNSSSIGTAESETFEGTLDGADKIIAALPSKAEQAKLDFQRDLGNLIDKGHEIGVEVEFMNPLTATMKALSENIITDQRTTK